MPNDTEQYKILMSMYDNEVSRFYSRQNIYLGLQMGAFAAVVAGLDTLLQHPMLFRIIMIFLTTLSLTTGVIATRGVTTQYLIMKIVLDIEKRSSGEWDILSLAGKHATAPLALNFILSAALAWSLCILWLVSFVVLELIEYQV